MPSVGRRTTRAAVTEVTRRGRDLLFDVLESEGVEHIFGNPGTTELPLMDALAARTTPAYVLALQEAIAVGMADGYAQATNRPAFLNLHTSAGLGNAIGNLTNARANGVGLVVTAGQQDRRHLRDDPMLSGDLVALARPVSKWSEQVNTVEDLPYLLRRAFKDAATPPRGPVFLSIPMDLFDVETDAELPPRSPVALASVAGGLSELADLLAVPPGELAIVAGDDVHDSPGGLEALAAVAEALGAPVFGAPLHGRLVFPPRHPLWAGALPPVASMIAERLKGFRRVLVIGAQAFMVYPWSPGSPVPSGTELLHLAPDAAQVGRAHPVVWGACGRPGRQPRGAADPARSPPRPARHPGRSQSRGRGWSSPLRRARSTRRDGIGPLRVFPPSPNGCGPRLGPCPPA